MEKPVAYDCPPPPKSAFCVHVLVAGSYSQKSAAPLPVPIYPLLPMENPVADDCPPPPKLAFCVQVLVAGSYSQKSDAPDPVPI